jgi:nucleotide-binding universal stress UspA family protein
VARVATERGVPAECQVVIGSPFQRIMEAARRADVIVMSTVGRKGIPRLLLGSIAERVVRHSPVPVMTIRAGAPVGRRTGPRRRAARARAARYRRAGPGRR